MKKIVAVTVYFFIYVCCYPQSGDHVPSRFYEELDSILLKPGTKQYKKIFLKVKGSMDVKFGTEKMNYEFLNDSLIWLNWKDNEEYYAVRRGKLYVVNKDMSEFKGTANQPFLRKDSLGYFVCKNYVSGEKEPLLASITIDKWDSLRRNIYSEFINCIDKRGHRVTTTRYPNDSIEIARTYTFSNGEKELYSLDSVIIRRSFKKNVRTITRLMISYRKDMEINDFKKDDFVYYNKKKIFYNKKNEVEMLSLEEGTVRFGKDRKYYIKFKYSKK